MQRINKAKDVEELCVEELCVEDLCVKCPIRVEQQPSSNLLHHGHKGT